VSDAASPTLWLGLIALLGLIGLAGLVGLRHPVARDIPGTGIRLLSLLGLLGLAGIWIPGAGAAGAFGALGLWNHPRPALHRIAKLGWLGVLGLPPIIMAVARALTTA